MTEPRPILKEQFNKPPYFDDYDSSKSDYYKILFKTETELQTRELNQIQSMIQEQIARLGTHIFQNGSIVTGCENKFNPSEFSASLYEDFFATRFSDYLDFFSDQFVISKNVETGNTKIGKISLVLHSSNNTKKNESVVLFSSISGDLFEENDVLSLYDPDTETTYSDYSIKIASVQNASTFLFNEGIIFVNGYFLYAKKQKVIVDPYTNSPSVSIGFTIEDSIVNYKDDFSLLDNSFPENIEYNNKVAIGADRYKIDSIVEVKPIITDDNFAEQTQLGNFFEFVRIDSGRVVKNVTTTIYSEIEKTLARRTYDESGNYTVRPFSCKVVENTKDNTKFNLIVSPGKAYVLGYEFDSIAPRTIPIPKSLNYETKESFDISTYYGNYIKVTDLSGFINISSCEEIEFHNISKENIQSGTKIGSARVRHLKKVGGSYWLYLFDVNLTTGSFDQVISIRSKSGITTATLVESSIHDTANDSLIFTFPEKGIRSLDFASYTIQKAFEDIRFSPSIEPGAPLDVVYGFLNLPSNQRFFSIPSYFTIVDNQTGDYLDAETIEYLDENSNSVLIKIISHTEFDGSILTLVDIQDASESKTGTETIKIINKSVELLQNQTIKLPAEIYLGVKITSIKDSDDNDLTSLFELKTGETKNLYESAYLIYIGQTELIADLTITCVYLNYSTSGYFSINSFDGSFDVPDIVVEETQKNLNRSSVIDFRPVIDSSGLISDAMIPIPDGTFECTYSFYYSRFDKLVVTSNKTFDIISGSPAYKPNVPNDRKDAMTLYTIFVPGGVNQPDMVNLKFQENKRYTMRDIGKLDHRIQNLEYYTALSLLEKDTETFEILDENGNNRFKNGFLVDNFKNFKSLDYNNPDINCSFDLRTGELRPSFDMMNTPCQFDANLSQSILAGELILLPYKTIPFIQQLQCSEILNLQPYEVFTWDGSLKLIPEIDEWVDTETKPDVTVNQMGETDIWEDIGASAFKAEWGSWETKITKVPSEVPLSELEKGDFTNIDGTEELKLWNPSVDSSVGQALLTAYDEWVSSGFKTWFDQTEPDGFVNGLPAVNIPFKSSQSSASRTGSQLAFDASKIITNSLGEKVTDISIVPFMRAKNIRFEAKNLKPLTQVYTFFDNKPVVEFCLQDGRGHPGYLETDDEGKVSGIFSLPGGVFSIGSKMFRICDNSVNNNTFITTVCETKFTANGLSQTKQETYLSTREPQLTTVDLSETKEVEDAVYAWGNLPFKPSPTPTPTLTPTPTPSFPNKTQVQLCLKAPLVGQRVKIETESDFLFLVDRSGSMQKSATYLDAIRDQMVSLLSNGGKNRFGLAYFRDSVNDFDEKWAPLQDLATTLTSSFSITKPFNVTGSEFYGFTGTESPLMSFNKILTHHKSKWTDLSTKTKKAIESNKVNSSFDFRNDRNKFVIIVTDELDEKLMSVPGNPIQPVTNRIDIIKEIGQNISDTKIYPILLIPNKTEYVTQAKMMDEYKLFIDKNFSGLGAVIGVDINGAVDAQALVNSINIAIDSIGKLTPNKVTVTTNINGKLVELNSFLIRDTLCIESDIINTYQSSIKVNIKYDPEIVLDPPIKTNSNGTLVGGNFSLKLDMFFLDFLECKLTKAYNQDNIPRFSNIDLETTFNSWFSNMESTSYYKFTETDRTKTVVADWHINTDPIKNVVSVGNKLFGFNLVPTSFDYQKYWNNPEYIALLPAIFSEIGAGQTFRETNIDIPLEVGKFNYVVISASAFKPSGNLRLTDPLAQSFTIDETLYPEGVFVSGLDVFFKTKSQFKPVRFELRTMVNGIPHSTEFIPFSRKFLYPEEIQISNDASIPTHVEFDAPIFLLPGDYCFCTIADTTEYNAYVAKLGEYQLGSSTERIESNPYSGVLFKSANSVTWLPQPDTDFKFVLYRCSFISNQKVSTVLINSDNSSPFSFNSACLNASIIIPDNTSMSIPRNTFLTQALNKSDKDYLINFNETTELNNTFVIAEI